MFIPIILLIITTLIITSLSSMISLKTSGYELSKKGDSIKEFIYQEQMIKEAVDSQCRDKFAPCIADTSADNEKIYTLSQLDPYYPLTNIVIPNSFSQIKLRTDTKEVVIVHSMDLETRQKYSKHYKNANETLICSDGSSLPCNGTIEKKIKYSPELQILFINDKISTENTKPIPDQNILNTLIAERDALNLVIANRKLKGWG